jgi:hypothetical protein
MKQLAVVDCADERELGTNYMAQYFFSSILQPAGTPRVIARAKQSR